MAGLNILLAIEEQAQESAEEMLNVLPWYCIYNAALKLLRPEVGERFGEGFREPRSEHDDELG